MSGVVAKVSTSPVYIIDRWDPPADRVQVLVVASGAECTICYARGAIPKTGLTQSCGNFNIFIGTSTSSVAEAATARGPEEARRALDTVT